LRGSAQLSGPFGRCTGELTELSIGGAFIAGAPPLRAGTKVRIHLLLPRSIHPIEAKATILYARPQGPLSPAGLGLAFYALEDADAKRIESTVERSDLLHMKLLFSLQSGDTPREQIDAACLEAGLPAGLPPDELHDRISLALRRFRGEF
jgi:hypothetical protein